MPKEFCGEEPKIPDPNHPTLWDYGFYRRLNSGKFEFISFCNPASATMIAVYKTDFENILNQLLPKKSGDTQ